MATFHNFEAGVCSSLLAYIFSTAKFAWQKTAKIKQTGKLNTKNKYEVSKADIQFLMREKNTDPST